MSPPSLTRSLNHKYKSSRYSDSDDCAKFYICLNGISPREQGCELGLVYNELSKQCDAPENVPEWWVVHHDDPLHSTKIVHLHPFPPYSFLPISLQSIPVTKVILLNTISVVSNVFIGHTVLLWYPDYTVSLHLNHFLNLSYFQPHRPRNLKPFFFLQQRLLRIPGGRGPGQEEEEVERSLLLRHQSDPESRPQRIFFREKEIILLRCPLSRERRRKFGKKRVDLSSLQSIMPVHKLLSYRQ